MDASGDKIGSVDVGVDDDADGLEDFNETSGAKTQKTRRLSSDDNVYESGNDVQVELEFTVDERPAELEGKSITIKGSIEDGMTQTKDAVRGVTNPTTKQIFAGEYYLYDGTIEKAKGLAILLVYILVLAILVLVFLFRKSLLFRNILFQLLILLGLCIWIERR